MKTFYLVEIVWNFMDKQLQKTFLLLCVVSFLFLCCGYQLLKIQHLKRQSEEEFEINFEEDTYQSKEDDNNTMLNRSYLLQIKYPLFQSNVPEEFPHVVNGKPRIPHIIHQIGRSTQIPDNFLEPMRSFVKHNPTWVYRFWTHDSGRLLLKKYHPYLLGVYDAFGKNDVKSSDLLRLVVLYEYGGIYADFDVKNLRSLNITTTKFACIIPTEPFEHASIIYGWPFILSNAVMLCRPKHPYFKQLLLQLQYADKKGLAVPTTGPEFLTRMYLTYNNLTEQGVSMPVFNSSKSNSPYFYKGKLDEDSDDAVYIPNSQYFGDNVDRDRLDEKGDLKDCDKKKLVKDPVYKLRACKEFESRKKLRKDKTFTFAIHYWFHLWNKAKKDREYLQKYDIKEVIPNAVLWETT